MSSSFSDTEMLVPPDGVEKPFDDQRQQVSWQRRLSAVVLAVVVISSTVLLDHWFVKVDFLPRTAEVTFVGDDGLISFGADIASSSVFNSYSVNGGECQAFHKSSDNEQAEKLAKFELGSFGEVKSRLQAAVALSESTQRMGITVDMVDVNFEVLRSMLWDVHSESKTAATSFECEIPVVMNTLSIFPSASSTIRISNTVDFSGTKDSTSATEKDSSQNSVEGTRTAVNYGSSMAEALMELLEAESDDYERSFNIDTTIHTKDKLPSSMESFLVDIPAASYRVGPTDSIELWNINTDGFQVNLADPNGAYIRTKVTLGCRKGESDDSCQIYDPAENIVNKVKGSGGSVRMLAAANPPSSLTDNRHLLEAESPTNFLNDVIGDHEFTLDVFPVIEMPSIEMPSVPQTRKLMESGNFSDIERPDVDPKYFLDAAGFVGAGFVAKIDGMEFHSKMTMESSSSTSSGVTEMNKHVMLDIGSSGQDIFVIDGQYQSKDGSGISSIGFDLNIVLFGLETTDVHQKYTVETGGGETVMTVEMGEDEAEIRFKNSVAKNVVHAGYFAAYAGFHLVEGIMGAERNGTVGDNCTKYSAFDEEFNLCDYMESSNYASISGLNHELKIQLSESGQNSLLLTLTDTEANSIVGTLNVTGDPSSLTLRGNFTEYGHMKFIFDTTDGLLTVGNMKIMVDGNEAIVLNHDVSVSVDSLFNMEAHINELLLRIDDHTVADISLDVMVETTDDSFDASAKLSNHRGDVLLGFDASAEDVMFHHLLDFDLGRCRMHSELKGMTIFAAGIYGAQSHFNTLFDWAFGLFNMQVYFGGDVIKDSSMLATLLVEDKWITNNIGFSMNSREILYFALKAGVEFSNQMNWEAILKRFLLRASGDEIVFLAGHTGLAHDGAYTNASMGMESRLLGEPVMDMDMDMKVMDKGDDEWKMSSSSTMKMFDENSMEADMTMLIDLDEGSFEFTRSISFSSLTPVPSMAPTAFPESTKTEVKFKSSLGFNANKKAFMENERAQEAAINAFRRSLKNDKAKVRIVAIYDATRRLREAEVMSGKRSLAKASILVDFETTIILETLPEADRDADAVYNSLSTSLSDSVSTGEFADALTESLDEAGVTDAVEVDDTSLEVGDAEVTVEQVGDDSSSSGPALGLIIGVIVAVVIVILVCTTLICKCKGQKKSNIVSVEKD